MAESASLESTLIHDEHHFTVVPKMVLSMLVEPCEKAARVRMEWEILASRGLREGLMRRAG